MKAYIMGNYTEKAFQGFLKDPTSDRKAVVEQLVKAMSGTCHMMDIVRGSYDFIVVVEVPSFDDFAAIKLVVEASGAVKNLTILEAIDFTKATTKAMGGTMHSMDIVRGSYDFVVVTDVPSFDDFAAIKLVVEASGAVKNLTILEAIDFTKATTKASKIGYKAPGQ